MGNGFGVRHYFVEGLTARGRISLVPVLTMEWQHLYILLGGAGTGKSTLIKNIGLDLFERGYEVDFWRSASDPDSIAGFLLPQAGIGMVDSMDISPMRWQAPGLIETFIDFNPFLDEKKLHRSKREIVALAKNIDEIQKNIEEQLAEDMKEKRRKGGSSYRPPFRAEKNNHLFMLPDDFNRCPQAKTVLQQLQMSRTSFCFLHGLGSTGWVNLVSHFIADCDQICFEGAETVDALNWIFCEAQHLGQVMMAVLHPLDPDEVIGLVFPERNLALWQGNPKENMGILSEKTKELLNNWHHQQTLLKRTYTEAMDFNRINGVQEELINKILGELAKFETEMH